jgi:hypothetical protein
MSAIGAVSLLVPGPKMIYHLRGWDTSIFSCNNGTVNTPNDTTGDWLDTKPQPQWVNNWLANNRSKILYGLDKDD